MIHIRHWVVALEGEEAGECLSVKNEGWENKTEIELELVAAFVSKPLLSELQRTT
ncbi:hypothetical protein GCM10025794_36550 [Massilia kyonggiensis]